MSTDLDITAITRADWTPIAIHDRRQLLQLASLLGVRADWHEPDEQNLTARVEGTHLDNAMGAGQWYGPKESRHAELYVVLSVTVEERTIDVAHVNLATLFAWACGFGQPSEADYSSAMDALGRERDERRQLAQAFRTLQRLLGGAA